MPEPDLFLLFIRPLNRIGVRYVVTGSVAAIFYGEPRVTHDVDLVVFLRGEDIRRLEEVFAQPTFYLPPIEVIATEVAREKRGHFNVIHTRTGFKADFYPSGRDEMNAWSFRNARRIEHQGEPLTLAPPESIIVSKLEYFREGRSEKHLRDIRAILAIWGDQIDRSALNDWIQRRGVTNEWRLV